MKSKSVKPNKIGSREENSDTGGEKTKQSTKDEGWT